MRIVFELSRFKNKTLEGVTHELLNSPIKRKGIEIILLCSESLKSIDEATTVVAESLLTSGFYDTDT